MSEELKRQVGGNHYKQFPLQPMFFNVANNMPWAEGEIIKYVTRWRFKGRLQDLKKAHHILGFLIEFHEGRLDFGELMQAIKDKMMEPPPPMSELFGDPSFLNEESVVTAEAQPEPELVGPLAQLCDLCSRHASWYIGAVHLCQEHEDLRQTNRAAFVQVLAKQAKT